MNSVMNRRAALGGLAVLTGTAFLPGIYALATQKESRAGSAPRLGPAKAFDFERLCERAKTLAQSPYEPAPVRAAETLELVDFDAHQKIRFRPESSLWADGPGAWPVQFFHPGRYFKEAVRIHVVEGGEAREVLFSPDMFSMPEEHVARSLPDDIGFAGFRVMEPGMKSDWVSFLGAAYFRTSGAQDQYGLSARGVAIDTATPRPEEFPRFTQFWLEPGGDDIQIVHALMDGPSITGAYRMIMRKDEGVVMEITKALYIRKAIGRLGIAPLTSMFWFSETARPRAADWRPEIHDSDGLAIRTGGGERIWRPLNNPPGVQTSSFMDENPKGFGLLQRDRDFANYQDDSVFYEKRPSVWIEPLGDWGEGDVQLVEIPTDDEIHDNIAAYWVPREEAIAGRELTYSYRLHWLSDEPYPAGGRVVSTRMGRGGRPGQDRPDGVSKFVIDFAGAALAALDRSQDVEPVVTASRGEIGESYTIRVVDTDLWRAVFDIAVEGVEPVELRCYLKLGDKALTETWAFQHFPG